MTIILGAPCQHGPGLPPPQPSTSPIIQPTVIAQDGPAVTFHLKCKDPTDDLDVQQDNSVLSQPGLCGHMAQAGFHFPPHGSRPQIPTALIAAGVWMPERRGLSGASTAGLPLGTSAAEQSRLLGFYFWVSRRNVAGKGDFASLDVPVTTPRPRNSTQPAGTPRGTRTATILLSNSNS